MGPAIRRLKESTQTGAELIGDDTSDADAEMIAMVIDALRETGLKEFQVELGQVEFTVDWLKSPEWMRRPRKAPRPDRK